MSDLDEELLDMVGGDSEDESVDDLDRLSEVQVDGEQSADEEAKESVEKVEKPPASRKGVAQKVKGRARRKRKQESDDEDGEVSPEPVELHQSGAASNDEADAPGEDIDEEEETPLFPVDGQFYSKTDRDHVLSLPEVERESILAERAEQEQKRRQDAILKNALAQSKAQKRRADDAGLEDINRRTTRPKTEKRSALDDYKRAREQKGADRNRLDTTRDRKEEPSPSSASERDADGESEVEWAEPSAGTRRDEPPAELRDFERCRVGRSNFTKVCFYPGFEEAIKGCFARVSIGLNRETGQNQYRMAQIKGFTEGKPYQMELPNGKHFTLDVYAIVAQGPHEKPWPLSACSDGKFTDSELARFTETLRKENVRAPPRKFLLHKLEAIHKFLNQQFTEETLQEKFAKQRAMEIKYDPTHVARQKRRDIARRRAEAEQHGDEEELQRCDHELLALENSSAASNGAAPLSNKPKSSPTKPLHHDRLAQLNAANRHKNTLEVRQALIAERKKVLRAREIAAAEKLNKPPQQAPDPLQSATADLFAETPQPSRSATPSASDAKLPRSATPLSAPARSSAPVGALKHKNMDDDVIASLDLGIDVEI